MSEDLYRCPTCGASLSLEQLRGTDCPYCKTVFPHHARAVEQAKVVNQVLAQQVMNANPWMNPGQVPQVPMQYGASPPQFPMGNPYANVPAQIDATVKRSMTLVFVIVGAVFGLMVVGGAVAWMLVAR